ncbi:hypothetical protein BLNAU_15744 [Blattamonas nauphoetae]|uniref:Uncharacterized protein n=1 Tax=Blattamonas nauphoetae TaxID=2049346 RepID=A0ABQ9XDC4_9EUKA|nr:hypothetical protein BLNAU_15744 [Blattamonas nauphoetae]
MTSTSKSNPKPCELPRPALRCRPFGLVVATQRLDAVRVEGLSDGVVEDLLKQASLDFDSSLSTVTTAIRRTALSASSGQLDTLNLGVQSRNHPSPGVVARQMAANITTIAKETSPKAPSCVRLCRRRSPVNLLSLHELIIISLSPSLRSYLPATVALLHPYSSILQQQSSPPPPQPDAKKDINQWLSWKAWMSELKNRRQPTSSSRQLHTDALLRMLQMNSPLSGGTLDIGLPIPITTFPPLDHVTSDQTEFAHPQLHAFIKTDDECSGKEQTTSSRQKTNTPTLADYGRDSHTRT